MAHRHSVYDSDMHFTIDPVKRTITNMFSLKNTLVQYDHNSERFTFEISREVEGHDMSICDRVEIHYQNIDAETNKINDGVYTVTDLQLSPDDDDVVICSWLISRNATLLAGSLNFIIRFMCTSDGEIDYAWSTAIFNSITISPSIYSTTYETSGYTVTLTTSEDTDGMVAYAINGGSIVEWTDQANQSITLNNVTSIIIYDVVDATEHSVKIDGVEIWMDSDLDPYRFYKTEITRNTDIIVHVCT